jgi:hypothetical protein
MLQLLFAAQSFIHSCYINLPKIAIQIRGNIVILVDNLGNLVYSRSRKKELELWKHPECDLHFMGGK